MPMISTEIATQKSLNLLIYFRKIKRKSVKVGLSPSLIILLEITALAQLLNKISFLVLVA